MCYYSTTMSNTRNAEHQENLVVGTAVDHAVLKAEKDNRVVCVMDDTMIHLEKLQLSELGAACTVRYKNSAVLVRTVLKDVIGKPVSGMFREYHAVANPDSHHIQRHGYASDCIVINGVPVHLVWLKQGTKCYVGDKKLALETRLGVDDPSIVHDHKPIDEQPGLTRVTDRALGLCSIVR